MVGAPSPKRQARLLHARTVYSTYVCKRDGVLAVGLRTVICSSFIEEKKTGTQLVLEENARSKLSAHHQRATRSRSSVTANFCFPMSDSFTAATQSYKYQSPNLSLFERVFLNAFWEVFVQVYPTWLAPNIITLCGGACVLALYFISEKLCPQDPSWYWVCGLLLLSYQTLDGTDGKQARRTKSGSALGELMDHGVDAVATAFAAMTVADATGFGISSPVSWFCVVGGQTAFFLSNLTLLHKGKQTFMSIDIMELQWVMIGTLILTGIVGGPKWWWETSVPGTELPMSYIVSTGSVVGTVGNIFAYIWSASWPYRQVDEQLVPEHVRRRAPGTGISALVHQVLVIFVYALLGYVNYALVKGVYAPRRPSTEEDLRPEIYRALLFCASWAFGDLMDRLLVMRVSHLELWTVPPCLFWMIAFAAVVGFAKGGVLGAWAVAIGALLGHLSFFVWVSGKLAKALGIQVFRIGGATKPAAVVAGADKKID